MANIEPEMVDLNHIEYELLRSHLGKLPSTWYPDLIHAMVEAAYAKEVFVRPHGCSNLIKRLEKQAEIVQKLFHMTEILKKAKLGMTRKELIAVMGEPDDKSVGTRKYPTPAVFKYGDTEFHFESWKNGKLWLIMDGKTHETWAKA